MSENDLPTVGWREWLALPRLGIRAIKAKVDTGARSSALHVDALQVIETEGRPRARFLLPQSPDSDGVLIEAEIIDFRAVTDSGGHSTRRPFIRTEVELAGQCWAIEINLTHRRHMLFPMLLGRTALSGRFLVDPAHSYLGSPARTT